MKKNSQKFKICIVLPGINYTHNSPYVLSTFPMLSYLEKRFDISLVYRKIIDDPREIYPNYEHLTLIKFQQMSKKEKNNLSPYYFPTNYLSLLKYQNLIENFAKRKASYFDLVIEKEWPFLGKVADAFSYHGVSTAIIFEAMFKYPKTSKANHIRKLFELALTQLRPHLRKRWCQKADIVVVETEQMKSILLDNKFFKKNKPIHSIPCGIDPKIFFPNERNLCRQKIGISKNVFLLTYVGSLNRFIQEPGPIIEALGLENSRDIILYMVGDGNKRQELEKIARKYRSKVIFTGKLSQQEASLYIGAANLCIAPYNESLYWKNQFTCGSLKIPEYLSCGRPVLTIPCARMNFLLDHQKYGFLVKNNVDSYRQFFKNLNFQEVYIKEKVLNEDLKNDVLKTKQIILTWEDIASLYEQMIVTNLRRDKNGKKMPERR